MKVTQTVDEYIISQERWRSELIELRNLMMAAGLEESVKWGIPVYTFGGKNVAGIAAFKLHVAIWFYQGALLKDEKKKLINAQEGTTKALRQWRFTSFEEIDNDLISTYINEAIQNERSGISLKPAAKAALEIPKELVKVFNESVEIKQNFGKLPSYKQREYIEFILLAKKQETKDKRIEKIVPLLLKGIGLNDKFR
jgi:uncharacterized protein YdeI (YjbR/CyaY-like superfamily)